MRKPAIFISDPEIVQEVMVTKNELIDKRGILEACMQNFLGNNGFVFAKSNESWKYKRKGIVQTFYKDKLIVMLEKLKEYTL